MARNRFLSAFLLWPLSRIYGAIVYARNRMFDMGILKQQEFDIPVVVVGNIAVGGTGKTPHTEYIIDALRDRFRIGVLSRGYKRHTKGFVLATDQSTPEEIGDEPYQMYQKYGSRITFAVCESRCEGIRQMQVHAPGLNLIILDDAFQHRYVKPKVSIVLTEFSRPVYHDSLMPYGRLREPISALNRADIVIVTKCPDHMKPMDARVFKNNLNLYPYQKLYFSSYRYGNLIPVFPDKAPYTPQLEWLSKTDSILIVSGIANPRPFVKHIKRFKPSVKVKIFDDHHNYTDVDFNVIAQRFNMQKGEKKYIITTEKDSVMLKNNKRFPEKLKPYMFYKPIYVQFLSDTQTAFDVELSKMITKKL
ncbi:MAG: tetraacyldisaccharide 4'-kinase [Muribaculaceae bacterium]|nr:tetraacyldisaccharide 4'-kinase [Muribaculaceae bacterium]